MTPQPLSHEMWFAQFEVYLHQQRYRAKTAHRYRTVCRQFLQYLQERDIALEQVEPATLEAYLQAQCQRYEQRHGRAPRQAHHLFNRGITLFLRFVHGHWPPPTLPTSPQACLQQQVCELPWPRATDYCQPARPRPETPGVAQCTGHAHPPARPVRRRPGCLSSGPRAHVAALDPCRSDL
jgi:hypothetical protein